MAIFLTGVAGFVGYSIAKSLLSKGAEIIGVDNLSNYYSVDLKKARLTELAQFKNFTFHQADICDNAALRNATAGKRIEKVLHLAAQPGVRYSLENPYIYARVNVEGFISVIELCRELNGFEGMVYASSSSVYGNNSKIPFAESDAVDLPASLYAATKRADELIAEVYLNLYKIPSVGLRFFTVYGPWGRPDMAPYKFTEAIFTNRAISLYNHGDMKRDFTYIDDIVNGVEAALDLKHSEHKIYNLGNHKSVDLKYFISVLEDLIGKKAVLEMHPMQKGEVKETYAEISLAERELNFHPKTPIEEGLAKFVEWYRGYHKVS